MRFCQRPLKAWIGLKKAPRFMVAEGRRIPNSEWRPLVATASKAVFKKGHQPNKQDYSASNAATKDRLAIISSFYQYLLLEECTYANPVALIRQKRKFVPKRQGHTQVRRLSQLQWQALIKTAQAMATDTLGAHERTLFIISVL
jgi:site-specific recombinase XerD